MGTGRVSVSPTSEVLAVSSARPPANTDPAVTEVGADPSGRAWPVLTWLICVLAACPCVHGQCDNRPDSDGRCRVDSCLPGFTGTLCDRQTTACGAQLHFCHAHADCDFSQGTVR